MFGHTFNEAHHTYYLRTRRATTRVPGLQRNRKAR